MEDKQLIPVADSAQRVSVPRLIKDGPNLFRIEDWQVFGPGQHKGRLYTNADMDKIVRNFKRLSVGDQPHLIPKAKLGHDLEERLKQSLGLPNVGRIVDCKRTPKGIAITVANIPQTTLTSDGKTFDLFSAIENGHYDTGSIELIRNCPDPDDPGKKIDGPVLESVSFLGEEQPAIKGQGSFGSDYFSNHFRGRHYDVDRVCFSEYEPMQSRDEMLQALTKHGIDSADPSIAALTDDQLAALIKQMSGEKFAAAMKEKYAAEMGTVEGSNVDGKKTDLDDSKKNPANTGDGSGGMDFQKFASECKQMFADMTSQIGDVTKRIGSLEQGVQEAQKTGKEVAAFSADFKARDAAEKKRVATERITAVVRRGGLSPYLKEAKIAEAMEHSNLTKDTFSAGSDSGLTPFEAYLRKIEARPSDERFSEDVVTNTDGTGAGISDFARKALSQTPEGRRALKLAEAEAAKK